MEVLTKEFHICEGGGGCEDKGGKCREREKEAGNKSSTCQIDEWRMEKRVGPCERENPGIRGSAGVFRLTLNVSTRHRGGGLRGGGRACTGEKFCNGNLHHPSAPLQESKTSRGGERMRRVSSVLWQRAGEAPIHTFSLWPARSAGQQGDEGAPTSRESPQNAEK